MNEEPIPLPLPVPDAVLSGTPAGGMPVVPALPGSRAPVVGRAPAAPLPSTRQQIADLQKDEGAAMQEVADAKAASAATRQAGAAKIGELQAGAPAVPDLKPLPNEFQHKGMSDKDVTDAMQTFFVLAALGGAMTRQPMTVALNAFGGAMKGMVEGDKQAFIREGQTFDRNLKVAMASNTEALTKYRAAMDKHKGDIGAAMQQIQLDAAAHNDTVTGAMARANNIKGVIGQMIAMEKSDQQATHWQQQFEAQTNRAIAAEAASRRSHELGMAKLQETIRHNQSGEQLGQERNAMKAAAAAQGGKPTATERQHYVDSNQLLKSVDRVESMLNDPTIRQKIDDSRVANYLSDAVENKAIQTFLVRPNLDPDVKTYLTEIANLRNQYYLDMSGKAVTGGEALRNFGAVVQPMDSASDVLNKMQIAKGRTQEKMRDMETYFPSLGAIRGGDRRNAAPAGAKPAAAAAPAMNEERTINGVPAVWDGKGWLPKQ